MQLHFCADTGFVSYKRNTLNDIQCLCMYPNRKHASYAYLNKYSSMFCGADIGLVTYGEKTLDNMQCLRMHPDKNLQNVTPCTISL